MDIRRDQEHPEEECEAECQHEGVEHRRTVTAIRIAATHEQHQAGEERGIDREVDRVAGGREADDSTQEVRVGVRVEVARDVERLTEEQQHPREACARRVHPHATRDCEQGRDADDVDDHGVALERRHEGYAPIKTAIAAR